MLAETAEIRDGFVVYIDEAGRRFNLEPASNPARNEYGYDHDYTWSEAVKKLAQVVWVDNGQPWTSGEL